MGTFKLLLSSPFLREIYIKVHILPETLGI